MNLNIIQSADLDNSRCVVACSEGSVLVDYFVELTELGRTVNTADMKRLFHESLSKYTANQAALVGDTSAASNSNNNQTEYRMGSFVVDPNYTDFIGELLN